MIGSSGIVVFRKSSDGLWFQTDRRTSWVIINQPSRPCCTFVFDHAVPLGGEPKRYIKASLYRVDDRAEITRRKRFDSEFLIF